MQKAASIDSKGRVTIPQEFRSEIGDAVVMKKTKEGVLLMPGEKEDFLAEFARIIKSEPRRTGRPTNPSPTEMKAVWHETS